MTHYCCLFAKIHFFLFCHFIKEIFLSYKKLFAFLHYQNMKTVQKIHDNNLIWVVEAKAMDDYTLSLLFNNGERKHCIGGM